MIENRFLYFLTPQAFEEQLNAGNIDDRSIVFVNGISEDEDEDGNPIYDEDYPFIYTHKVKFAGGGGGGGSTVKPYKFEGTILAFKSNTPFDAISYYMDTQIGSYEKLLKDRKIVIPVSNENIAIALPEGVSKPSGVLTSQGFNNSITLSEIVLDSYETCGISLAGYTIYRYVPLVAPTGTITLTFN